MRPEDEIENLLDEWFNKLVDFDNRIKRYIDQINWKELDENEENEEDEDEDESEEREFKRTASNVEGVFEHYRDMISNGTEKILDMLDR